MEEPIVPVSHHETEQVAPDRRKEQGRQTSGERLHVQRQGRDSAASRVDAYTWDEYFSERAQQLFILFRDQEMYNRYIQSSRQSLEYAIATEREDAKMRVRWDQLRDAFHEAFERELKAQVKPAEKPRPQPFSAQVHEHRSGAEVRAKRVFRIAQEWRTGKRQLESSERLKKAAEEDFVEHSWRMHKIHRLVINRKLRRTQNDSMDILVEEAA